jgi:hypothetical protein
VRDLCGCAERTPAGRLPFPDVSFTLRSAYGAADRGVRRQKLLQRCHRSHSQPLKNVILAFVPLKTMLWRGRERGPPREAEPASAHSHTPSKTCSAIHHSSSSVESPPSNPASLPQVNPSACSNRLRDASYHCHTAAIRSALTILVPWLGWLIDIVARVPSLSSARELPQPFHPPPPLCWLCSQTRLSLLPHTRYQRHSLSSRRTSIAYSPSILLLQTLSSSLRHPLKSNFFYQTSTIE